MQSSILGLIVAVMGQVAEPVSETQWTIEEIRKGFEALTTSWQTREIHYVRFPSRVFDAPIDNPDRLEGVVRQSSTRQFIVDQTWYQNGVPAERRHFGFDGERLMNVFYHRPPPPDPKQAEIKSVAIQGSNDTVRLTYPHPYDLYFGRPFLDWLQLPSARVVERVEIEGSRCLRVEVTLPVGVIPVPTGSLPIDQEQRLTIAIDPAKDFWPREYVSVGLHDKKRRESVCRFSDFRHTHNRWFPFKVSRGDTTHGEQFVITNVVFDRPMSKVDFHPAVPDGTQVIEGQRMYLTGGERGQQIARGAAKKAVEKHAQEVAGEAVSTHGDGSWSRYGWSVAIMVVAIVSVVVAVVLRQRQ